MAPLRRRPGSRAFTLIELLVVIAIIAILTAILLPVFASVREGGRQGVSISNLKDIQQKMEQFKLDNHRYPDVLFGYYYNGTNGTTMKSALGAVQQYDTTHSTHLAALYFPGLYPAYIKDPDEFKDPNNTTVDDNSPPAAQVVTPGSFTLPDGTQGNMSLVAPCSASNDNILRGDTASGCGQATPGNLVGTIRSFYTQDAYDSNPTVVTTNQINDPTAASSYLVRYQIAREQTGTTDPNSYTHQLRWQNPPAETFVTCSTYHVKNADKVLVLFESGAVKKMTGADFHAKEGASNFWTVTP